MGIDVAPFEPETAAEDQLTAYHRMLIAVREADWPEDQLPNFETSIGSLRASTFGPGTYRFWTAHLDDQLMGIAKLGLLAAQNSKLAVEDIRVHPQARRLGIGTALLRASLPVMLAEGRVTLGSAGVVYGSAGAKWVESLGFRTTSHFVLQRLDLTSVDQSLWQVAIAEGYRVERWAGEAPADLLDSYALAKSAIHDAPRGDSSYRAPSWTAEKVREAESELRKQSVDQRVVVAVHEDSGTVVGLTELGVYPHMRHIGFQRDTAVLAEYRGHGIGRLVKSKMLRWLAAEMPELKRIDTSTGATNNHMIAVNHQVGFTTFRSLIDVERDARELAAEQGV